MSDEEKKKYEQDYIEETKKPLNFPRIEVFMDREEMERRGREKSERFLTPEGVPQTIEEYERFVKEPGGYEILLGSEIDPRVLKERLRIEGIERISKRKKQKRRKRI